MAYAAVISTKMTIHRLLNSPQISILPTCREILESTYKEVRYLQEILERVEISVSGRSSTGSSEKVFDALNQEIREVVYKLEDAVDSHVSNHLHGRTSPMVFSIELEMVLKQDINSLKETAKKMKEEYHHIEETIESREEEYLSNRWEIISFFKDELESRSTMPEEDDLVDFDGNKSTDIVGLSHQIWLIKYSLSGKISSLFGGAGTGKTTVVRKVFEDESIGSWFDHCAFVTVGPKHQIKEIMLMILYQLNHDICVDETLEQLLVALNRSLSWKTCLIVFDDVRNKKCWDELRQCLPDHKNRSEVMVTTRLKEVAEYVAPHNAHPVSFLDREESWILFCERVFGQHQSCPFQLELYGRQIVNGCASHPLTIIAFACLLSKAEKTPEYWGKVAERKNSFFIQAYDEMSKVPLPSYDSKCQMSKEYDYKNESLDSSKSENMIGLYDQFSKIKDWLTDKERQPWLDIISFVGMAGIGKTFLARKLFEDESVQSHFDLCAFVTIGQKYKIKEIMLAILSQICGVHSAELEHMEAIALYQCLKDRKYLIVLDDVWDTMCCDQLYLPDGRSGSRVLVTTRLQHVAESACSRHRVHRMPFLSEEESLYLLREKVFGVDQSFPESQLEKAAKKIVKTCQGLPLTIIAVADLLSKAKTPQYWNEVAKKGYLVLKDVGDALSKVLIKSYNHLHQHLKACFLYMGVFPPNCDITASKLIKLWIAEGFLDPSRLLQDLEGIARECLDDLSKSDLILVHDQCSYNYKTKICSLHSAYWYLCNKEAEKENFLHVVNNYSDIESIDGQRRMCIHNNMLFGIKEVYYSMESNASTARSLLCTGPNHQYPLPISCPHWKLLRVLDALTIRFYKFPIEVLELVQLRYLALIYSGKIPALISKLRYLHYLIIQRQMSIVSSAALSYLPIEIWNMQELRCLQVMGSDLPYHDVGAPISLPNLLTISYMSANCCAKEILERTPNLKKLGIQIELAPLDIASDHNLLRCFDHLYVLHQLESLKCVVEKPNPISQVVALPTFFPSCLAKLSLNGLGYPWEYMRIIAELPFLEVLKLRCYAFQGPKWWIHENEFQSLEFLLIEDANLQYWGADEGCISRLERLIIRHCYNLQEIPTNIGQGYSLKTLEVVDCPLALDFVKKMQDENDQLQVCLKSSWNEKRKP